MRESVTSLNRSELRLYSDSSSSEAWAEYATALLAIGQPVWAEYAVERAEDCDETSAGLLRIRATCQWLQGDRSGALEYLTSDSIDSHGRLILAFYLQELGDAGMADSIFSLVDPVEYGQDQLVELYFARRYRILSESDSAMVPPDQPEDNPCADEAALCQMENLLHGGGDMEEDELIQWIEEDVTLTGGVYAEPLLAYLETLDQSPGILLARSRLLCILDRKNEAEDILPSFGETGQTELVHRKIDLLIELDRLSEAMEQVSRLLQSDSLDAGALQQRGILLLRGGRYSEAFTEMEQAYSATGSPTCLVLQGLAAELACHTKLAFETYSTLVSAMPDSIVLINRCRSLIENKDPEDLIRAEELSESFQDYDYSGFSGSASLSFYSNAGEYENRSFSVNSNLVYLYGLYGSNVSLDGRYTFNRYPESDNDYRAITASVASRNYSTSRFYQQLLVDWEKRDYTTDRNRLEASAGAGYKLQTFNAVSVTPYAGLGRSYEKIDSSSVDHWIIVPELHIRYSGTAVLGIVPFFGIGAEAAYNLDDSDGYELTLLANADLMSSSTYTFSLGYEAIQSYQPESDYYYMNRSTYITLSVRFD